MSRSRGGRQDGGRGERQQSNAEQRIKSKRSAAHTRSTRSLSSHTPRHIHQLFSLLSCLSPLLFLPFLFCWLCVVCLPDETLSCASYEAFVAVLRNELALHHSFGEHLNETLTQQHSHHSSPSSLLPIIYPPPSRSLRRNALTSLSLRVCHCSCQSGHSDSLRSLCMVASNWQGKKPRRNTKKEGEENEQQHLTVASVGRKLELKTSL